MSLTMDDFSALQKKVERAKKEMDMAAGSLQQLFQQLKKQHGLSTLEEAEQSLKDIMDEELAALKKYNKAKKEYEDAFGESEE